MRCSVSKPLTFKLSSCNSFACPVQILVIDQPNGPANILVDTIGRLLNREISVMSVEEHTDALHALDCFSFDLIVVGLQHDQSRQLTILPWLYEAAPDRPLLVVGRHLPRLYQQYARTYGAREVLNMPERAADLKRLVSRMAQRYFKMSVEPIQARAS